MPRDVPHGGDVPSSEVDAGANEGTNEVQISERVADDLFFDC